MGRDYRVRTGQPLIKHLQQLHDRLADVARDVSLLKSRLRSPTNPVYDPEFPLDAVNGQFALHGGLPYYYWAGAWHIFAGANVWVYFGTFGVDPLTTADSIPYDAPWINTGGMATPVEPLRFRLSPDLNLELEGSFTGGVSGQPLGTLAVPWRPDYEKWFVIVAQQPGGSVIPYAIQVATTGVLTPYELLTAGPTGADGVDGVSIHVGAGVPANSLGNDGDLDINSTNGDYYLKVAGVYVLQGNLTGPAGPAGAAGAAGTPGSVWRDGAGAPSNALGVNGDYYLDDTTEDVYLKTAGAYAIVTNIKGAPGAAGAAGAAGTPGSVWRDGAGAPSNALGVNGDYYLNDTNGAVYLKTAGVYAVVANITGPTGATGAATVWRDGAGAPSNALGVNGDYYLDDTTGDVYLKTAGAYAIVANIKGAVGATGPTGPAGGLGGDSLFTWMNAR